MDNDKLVPNLNVNLRSGGRKALNVSEKTFIEEYIKYCKKLNEDYDNVDEDCFTYPVILFDRTQKYKVKFSIENYGLEEVGVTSTGIPYVAAWYAGDWEYAVLVFYYLDSKGKITNYIPTLGNSWNTLTSTAFGSEEESDKYDNLCKKYVPKGVPDWYKGEYLKRVGLRKGGIPICLDVDDKVVPPGEYTLEEVDNRIDFDINECRKDFESRVTF